MAGELPSTEVASSGHSYAFRDLHPVAPTHVLVVPKRHIDDASTVAPADGPVIADMLALAREVATAEGLGDKGYRLIFNVGEDSGNTVAHLHMHVIGGRPLGWPHG